LVADGNVDAAKKLVFTPVQQQQRPFMTDGLKKKQEE